MNGKSPKKAGKTLSQLRKERAWEASPGWTVKRRSMDSDGSLNLVLMAGKVKVDMRIGRRGAEKGVLRSPASLTDGDVIASLITARSEEMRHG